MAVIEMWGSTEIKIANFHFTWTIKNFSFCPQETGQMLVSPEYSTGGDDAARWAFELFPKGWQTDMKECVAIFLRLNDSNKPSVNAKFKLSILNEKREKIIVYCADHEFVKGIDGDTWGWRKFIKMDFLNDEKNKLLPNDQLTIDCELSLIEGVINKSGGDETFKINVPDCDLSKNMEVLFNKNGETDAFTDATLMVSERQYETHRAVLASRTSFFDEMFVDLSTDDDSLIFVIPDIEEKIFNEILNFIYTDRVNDIETIAEELLPAAARFHLPGLKVICEESLAKSLSVENAAKRLLLAHDSGANALRTRTIDFIKENASAVVRTEQFVSLLETHPRIIAAMEFETLFLLTKSDASDGTSLHETEEEVS